MFDQLALNEITRRQLDRFAGAPSHAILLTGPAGIGKGCLALALAKGVLGVKDLTTHPYFLSVTAQHNVITIEQVRGLKQFLHLKTLGDQPIRRVVIVELAESMTTEAQNALLKLLEEPPADTLFVLTAARPAALLPTVLSRTQQIAVYVPAESDVRKFYADVTDADWRQSYLLSGGLPGLIHALLQDGEPHPMLGNISLAKDLLTKEPFERLTFVDGLSKQKDQIQGLVASLDRIAEAGLKSSADQNHSAKMKRWHNLRKKIINAEEALERNANAKLVLTNLLLHL